MSAPRDDGVTLWIHPDRLMTNLTQVQRFASDANLILDVVTKVYGGHVPILGLLHELGVDSFAAVSYTHLTLPTIYYV